MKSATYPEEAQYGHDPMSTPTKTKRPSKHDEEIKIDAPPETVVQSLFNGRPKRKWRYLSKRQSLSRRPSSRTAK